MKEIDNEIFDKIVKIIGISSISKAGANYNAYNHLINKSFFIDETADVFQVIEDLSREILDLITAKDDLERESKNKKS